MAAARVPPELWIKIIREVSHVPEALDTRTYDALPPRGKISLHSKEVFAMMCESLSTKFSVSLVCRMWNSICAEFLYEFIVVRDAAHFPHLLELLSHTHPEASKWVRRLDFVCDVPGECRCLDGTWYTDKQLVRAASKLIRRCRHLLVFSSEAAIWEADIRSLAKALNGVAKALESLNWNSPWAPPPVPMVSRLRFPRLQLLLLSEHSLPPRSRLPSYHYGTPAERSDDDTCDMSDEGPFTTHGRINFPPLHTLSLRYYGRWLSLFPDELSHRHTSLRHIVIGRSAELATVLRTILEVNPQIDSLTFCHDAFRQMDGEGFVLPKTVRSLAFYLEELPMTPLSLPHVQRIGLKGTETPAPEVYDYALNLFVGDSGYGTDDFSSLNLIRFMDATLARTLEKRQFQFKLWEYRCRSKGVKLEDEKGQLMIPGRL